MLGRILLIISVVVLAGVAALYLIGRGRVEDTAAPPSRPPLLDSEARLQTVRLYFGDRQRIALRPEERSIVMGKSLSEKLEACVDELVAGSLQGSAPVLPPGTRLRRAFLDPWGLAYLDFDGAIRGASRPGDGEEWLAVAAIVRTVCDNFPQVREVRFMVDGQVVTSLGGYIDLEQPLSSGDFAVEEY